MIVEKILEAKDLAYLAGLVDGEGSITLSRRCLKGKHIMPNYMLRVSVDMTNREPVEFVSNLFRGHSSSKSTTVTGKPIYYFVACNSEARRMLSLILPFLKCKHRQARLALAFTKLPKAFTKMPLDKKQYLIRQRDNYVSLMRRFNGDSWCIQTGG